MNASLPTYATANKLIALSLAFLAIESFPHAACAASETYNQYGMQ